MTGPNAVPRRHGLALLAMLALPRGAAAQAVFPPGSAIGLEPPPGYVPSEEEFGFEDPAEDAVLILTAEPPRAGGFPDRRAALQARLRLAIPAFAANGFRANGRRPFDGQGFEGILTTGTTGLGETLETACFLLLESEHLTGTVVWKAGSVADDPRRLAMERALATIVTRPLPSMADRLALLPFRLKSSVFTPYLVQRQRLMLASGPPANWSAIVSRLPALDPPAASLAEAAGRLLEETTLDSFVRDATVDRQGPATVAGLEGWQLRGRGVFPSNNRPILFSLRLAVLPDGRYLTVLGHAAAADMTGADLAFADLARYLILR